MKRTGAIGLIIEERNKQVEKWGDIKHSPFEYIPLIVEELGEAARHANEIHWNGKYYNVDEEEKKRLLIGELSQVAALCIAALEVM